MLFYAMLCCALLGYALLKYAMLSPPRAITTFHHEADSDLRPNLRLRRSKMGEDSSSFGVEHRRWRCFDLRGRKSKIEDGIASISRLRRSKVRRLRFSKPKHRIILSSSSIFSFEDRRTAHLQSSNFGSKIEAPSIFDLRPRRDQYRTEDGGGNTISLKMEWGLVLRRLGRSSIFRV